MVTRLISSHERGKASQALLEQHIKALGFWTGCEAEFKFHPVRKWRFDLAWPDLRIAVEIDGGNTQAVITKTGRAVAVGRHTQEADYEKLNAAALLRWRVFRFTPAMVKKGVAIDVIEKVLTANRAADQARKF